MQAVHGDLTAVQIGVVSTAETRLRGFLRSHLDWREPSPTHRGYAARIERL
jgi:hypothetical protein